VIGKGDDQWIANQPEMMWSDGDLRM
jgi:hypothetical protein